MSTGFDQNNLILIFTCTVQILIKENKKIDYESETTNVKVGFFIFLSFPITENLRPLCEKSLVEVGLMSSCLKHFFPP